jgi:hypothetical protein
MFPTKAWIGPDKSKGGRKGDCYSEVHNSMPENISSAEEKENIWYVVSQKKK